MEMLILHYECRSNVTFHLISEMNGKPSSDSGPTAEDAKQSNTKQSETRHRRGGAAAAKQRYKKGKS